MSQPRTPLSVTGGCLCGAIRYTLTFPANAEWPPKRNSTCQCTMCRKFTGALLPQGISLPTSHISPPLTSNETYKSYQSSPLAYRSFCSNCGSSLAFNYNRCPEVTEIYHGSLDEEVLCGKKISGAEDGMMSKREGSDIGYDLCKARNHNWIDNSIKGITDKGEGNLYLRGSDVPYKRT